jgi:hypothetical protein
VRRPRPPRRRTGGRGTARSSAATSHSCRVREPPRLAPL